MRAYYQGPPLSNPWARVDFERHLPKQQSGNDQILGAVAVEEGAHALVATCLGGRVLEVGIDRWNRSGHCDFDSSRMSLVDHAACLMAGSIALRRAGLGHLGRGQGHDETRLNELVRMSGRGEVFRERARARAELLVDSNFPAIRRVADALARKDSLSVEEFQQLISKLKEIGVLVGELSTDEQNAETKVAQAENTKDDENSLKSASKKLKDKQEKDGRLNISCKNGHQVGQYRVRGDGRLDVWRYGNNWNRVYVRSASSVAAGRRMLAGGCNCR